MLSIWLKCEESCRWWQLIFANVSQVGLPARYPCNILFCPFVISDTPCLYPYYIYPYYLHMLRSVFQRENPSHYTWELEIVIPTILYTIHNPLWFSSTSTSQSPNPWEVDNPNTYHTHSKCKVRFWCCWKVLEETICLVDAIGLNCVIQRAREGKASSSQLVAGAWRAQVHGVD